METYGRDLAFLIVGVCAYLAWTSAPLHIRGIKAAMVLGLGSVAGLAGFEATHTRWLVLLVEAVVSWAVLARPVPHITRKARA